ncbi:hypothetical protein ACFQH6_01550 [Halobacteriaceae archaeon GCM10025711]
MGRFAGDVQAALRTALADRLPELDWRVEHDVAGTPVDVTGVGDDLLVLVELEWRRADPADNTAKLFRHLDAGRLDAPRVVVCQLFTGYYDLAAGGVSSKRLNAEFVGRVADDALDRVEYHPVEFGLTPPKRGGDRPDGWKGTAATAADAVARLVHSA